ncbi:hypothetical protein [Microbispora sp. CA-102843]|uniref:hypothetical protein n=1 Tax=Microbispora sp. CA-102843 TaxID=3239952 RepID=UPI003D8E1F85
MERRPVRGDAFRDLAVADRAQAISGGRARLGQGVVQVHEHVQEEGPLVRTAIAVPVERREQVRLGAGDRDRTGRPRCRRGEPVQNLVGQCGVPRIGHQTEVTGIGPSPGGGPAAGVPEHGRPLVLPARVLEAFPRQVADVPGHPW